MISIVGYSTNNKVPGFFAETVYGAGPISIGDIPLVLLLLGTKTSAGSATADQDIDDVLSETDADTLYGPGSELAVMCYGALQIPGVKLKAAATAEAGGAAAATATITITGTWTTAGTFSYRIDGVLVTGTVLSTDTISTLADSIVAAINGNTHLPVTAAKGAGPGYVVTLTRKSKGARGNQGVLFQVISELPSGCSSAIAGSASITGGGVNFGATLGSGADSLTTILGLIDTDQYDRIAFAQNDATAAAAMEAFLNTQAGPLVGFTMHAICAVNGTYSAALSLAQTTLNAERVQCMWYLNSETIPSFIAATFAAYRTFVEQTDPDAAYDGYILPGVAPQSQQADWPTMSSLIAALDNGLTPIATNRTGGAYVVRSITTKSLDSGGNPDYRTLDTSDAVVPDYVRRVLDLYWTQTFKVSNPRVGPDPVANQREPAAGVATPTLWNRNVTKIMKDLETQLIVTDVHTNPPVSEYNTTAKRIMSIVPVKAAANQHSIGVSVRGVG